MNHAGLKILLEDLKLKDRRLPDSPDMVRRREDIYTNGTPLLCLSIVQNWELVQFPMKSKRKKFKTHGEVRAESSRNS